MKPISDEELRTHFLGWQCRIRQLAARQDGGRPSPGMCPRVLDASGKILLAAMTTLIVPADPSPSTAFFRFQIQKSPDPRKVYESALDYLQGEYFSTAAEFSDELTAVFGSNSKMASELVRAGQCLLEFAQYGQIWRLSCGVRRLRSRAPARQASLWQARAFNPDMPADAAVLGFKPDWRSAGPSPLPAGIAERLTSP